MTTGLDVLYRDVILDHSKRPRNFRMFDGGHHGVGANPLCGDRLTVYLRVENETIQDAAFHGFGCAIAIASASLMTESVRGKTLAETRALFDQLLRMISAPAESPVDDLGDLSSLAGVRQFPVRVKCATLPWQALLAATTAGVEVVSTE
jgi:nitrogen fixation protein NifU and related proteins